MKYLPQFFPSTWIRENGVFGIEFTDEISIGFVIKEDGYYSYLMQFEFDETDVTPKSLLKVAIDNLNEQLEDCEIKAYSLEGGALAFWNSENDNFTAVRILSEKYSLVLKTIFPVDFYFSVADRDTITCWQTSDENEHNKFAAETIEDFNESDYGLSGKTFRFSETKL